MPDNKNSLLTMPFRPPQPVMRFIRYQTVPVRRLSDGSFVRIKQTEYAAHPDKYEQVEDPGLLPPHPDQVGSLVESTAPPVILTPEDIQARQSSDDAKGEKEDEIEIDTEALDSMTKAELTDLASRLDLDIADAAKKADIREAILTYLEDGAGDEGDE